MEVVIALGIGAMIMTLVTNAYVGANKSQAITVGTGLLKSSGQTGLNDLYQNLHSSALIFDRNTYTDALFTRLPINGVLPNPPARIEEPGLNPADIVYPQIQSQGQFFAEDASNVANANWNPAAIGNCLFFATHEPKAILREEPSSTRLKDATGASEAHISAYRLHFYFLVRRPLAVGSKPVRTGDNFTYQLMHWKSMPYLDHDELRAWMLKIVRYSVVNPSATPAAPAYIATKIAKLRHPDAFPNGGTGPYPAAVNFNTPNPASSNNIGPLIVDLNPTNDGTGFNTNLTRLFETDSYHHALRYNMRDRFGESFISFNTKVPSPLPTHRVPGLEVPRFALPAVAPPYGFEVLVGGEPSHRQVLLRMALAARTQPGNVMVGQAFQQVVHIFATAPERPAATPTPTPAPTPTPGPT